MWFRELLRSFQYAFQGFFRSVREERNLRIELAAACYAIGGGFAAALSPGEWIAVLLCCGLVIAAELFNTALERLCDEVHPGRSSKIGAAKDAAAAAVQAMAFVSLGVAYVIFGPWLLSDEPIKHPWMIAVVVLSLPFAILWIRGKKSWKSKNRE